MVFVVASDGLSLAKVDFMAGEPYGYIYDLNVHESVRGQGRADDVLVRCLGLVKARGYHEARLSVIHGSWMEEWYMRMGFKYVKDVADGAEVYAEYSVQLPEEKKIYS